MFVNKIDWSKYIHVLGTKTDDCIAQELNCRPETVRAARKRRGIPSFGRPKWSDQDESLAQSNLRLCVECKNIKSPTEFNVKGSTYTRTCKSCVYQKARILFRDRKTNAVNILGGCCQSCGFNSHLSSLQFHHVNPGEKENHISYILGLAYDEAALIQE